jgi:hypothetical protein
MDMCIIKQLRNVLPKTVTDLIDENPDIQLRLRSAIVDPTGNAIEQNEILNIFNVPDSAKTVVAHAWQPLSKFTMGTLKLAGVSMYTEFSTPRLHVSAAVHARRFTIALDAEVSSGTFRDVPINNSWVPGDTLFIDNNMITCQLLIPQATALVNALQVLMPAVPNTWQYSMSFARALKDYQLAKIRQD